MPYKSFKTNDIFINTIKTKPSFELKLGFGLESYNGSVIPYYNDININDNNYYRYILKDSSKYFITGKKNLEAASTINYGEQLKDTNPRKVSLTSLFFPSADTSRIKIKSLENTLNLNVIKSQHYAFSSSYGNKATQDINLINIPSLFYGSSIDKGSMELGFYVNGKLVGKLQDKNNNGELIETYGTNIGSVAGIVLYEQGIVLLTGSWSLDDFTEPYLYPSGDGDNPKWIYWGAGVSEEDNQTINSIFTIKFNGVNYIQTLTMFAHADKGEFNHSNNLTYIQYGENSSSSGILGPQFYKQPNDMEIKKTTKYPYENFTGSLEKQTFISKIAIYDENKNIIAIAKLATPVRKTENRDFVFKLKLDI